MASELQWVAFRVGQQTYALPIAAVREIVRAPHITAVPQAPDYVAGVINLRGRIVPVIDMRKRFLQPVATSPKNRILVMANGGKLTGLLVDAASEVVKLAAAQVEPSPKLFGDHGESYVSGIARCPEKLIVLLDAAKLLHDEPTPEGAML